MILSFLIWVIGGQLCDFIKIWGLGGRVGFGGKMIVVFEILCVVVLWVVGEKGLEFRRGVWVEEGSVVDGY